MASKQIAHKGPKSKENVIGIYECKNSPARDSKSGDKNTRMTTKLVGIFTGKNAQEEAEKLVTETDEIGVPYIQLGPISGFRTAEAFNAARENEAADSTFEAAVRKLSRTMIEQLFAGDPTQLALMLEEKDRQIAEKASASKAENENTPDTSDLAPASA